MGRDGTSLLLLLCKLAFHCTLAAAAAAAAPATTPAAAAGVRTGILCHGCHLQTPGWTSIMWGKASSGRVGRLVKTVKLAVEEDAAVVVFGTGASFSSNGTPEGQHSIDYLLDHWNELASFPGFPGGQALAELKQSLAPKFVAEVTSTNTQTEIAAAAEIFREYQCERVVLVSSPSHLPRCLREACAHADAAAVAGEEANTPAGIDTQVDAWKWTRPTILAVPSDTCYEGFEPGDTCIIEPEHRGDRQHLQQQQQQQASPEAGDEDIEDWSGPPMAFTSSPRWSSVEQRHASDPHDMGFAFASATAATAGTGGSLQSQRHPPFHELAASALRLYLKLPQEEKGPFQVALHDLLESISGSIEAAAAAGSATAAGGDDASDAPTS